MSQLQNTRTIQERLLKWYYANKRTLPWRKTRDPYAIWISEIMLQQTQVETVIPYYERWLKKFPDPKRLAQASEDEVLKAWEGLGYYSRARNLHRAAKEITGRHDGKIPSGLEQILALPGIGRYTAGAILSIAFDQPVPLVDGNVIRVITRLFNIHTDTNSSSTQKRIWDIAAQLVPRKHPGDFNQALMELGATLCTPGTPRCLLCPLNEACLGLKKSNPARLPVRHSTFDIQKFQGWIHLIERKGSFLIQQRPEGSLMGGLWEFPSSMDGKIKEPEKLIKKEILGKIQAAFTKYRGVYQVVHLKVAAKPSHAPANGSSRWVKPADFKNFTFSAPSRKVLALKGWA